VNEKDFDLAQIGQLHFKEMDCVRFPMLALAYKVGRLSGSFPTVYNAANEIAANAFIDGKISYLAIEELITRAVDEHIEKENLTLEDVFAIDQLTREKVQGWIANGR